MSATGIRPDPAIVPAPAEKDGRVSGTGRAFPTPSSERSYRSRAGSRSLESLGTVRPRHGSPRTPCSSSSGEASIGRPLLFLDEPAP